MSYSATPPGANQTKSFLKASFFRYDCYKSLIVFSPSSLLVFSVHYPLSSIHDLRSSPCNKVHPFPGCCYRAPFVGRIPYCLHYYHQHYRYGHILKLGGF